MFSYLFSDLISDLVDSLRNVYQSVALYCKSSPSKAEPCLDHNGRRIPYKGPIIGAFWICFKATLVQAVRQFYKYLMEVEEPPANYRFPCRGCPTQGYPTPSGHAHKPTPPSFPLKKPQRPAATFSPPDLKDEDEKAPPRLSTRITGPEIPDWKVHPRDRSWHNQLKRANGHKIKGMPRLSDRIKPPSRPSNHVPHVPTSNYKPKPPPQYTEKELKKMERDRKNFDGRFIFHLNVLEYRKEHQSNRPTVDDECMEEPAAKRTKKWHLGYRVPPVQPKFVVAQAATQPAKVSPPPMATPMVPQMAVPQVAVPSPAVTMATATAPQQDNIAAAVAAAFPSRGGVSNDDEKKAVRKAKRQAKELLKKAAVFDEQGKIYEGMECRKKALLLDPTLKL